MRILFDTDIVLDLLLERAGFVDEAAALFDAHNQGKLQAHSSAITPINVFYLARKVLGREDTTQAIYELRATVDVCPVNLSVLQDALVLPLKNYEDAAQVASAIAGGLDAIITRNCEGDANAPLPIYSPTDFLASLTAHPNHPA